MPEASFGISANADPTLETSPEAPPEAPPESLPLRVDGIAPWYGSQAGMNETVLEALGYERGEGDGEGEGEGKELWLGGPRHFYDLCCGGGSLLLAKPKAAKGQREVINDLHGGMVNLCRVLVSFRADALQSLLEKTVNCTAVFDEAVAFRRQRGYLVAPGVFEVDTDHVMAAYYQFVEWWLGAGGEAGTKGFGRQSLRYTQGGGSSDTRFRSAVASVPYLRWRLERVEVWQQDMIKLAGKIGDEAGTCIYCDTPFLPTPGKGAQSGGARYEHTLEAKPWVEGQASMFGEVQDDFDLLAKALDRFVKATVVVRHYEHPRMDELFPPGRWRRVYLKRHKQLASAGAGKLGKDGFAASGEQAQAPEMLMVKAGWA